MKKLLFILSLSLLILIGCKKSNISTNSNSVFSPLAGNWFLDSANYLFNDTQMYKRPKSVIFNEFHDSEVLCHTGGIIVLKSRLKEEWRENTYTIQFTNNTGNNIREGTMVAVDSLKSVQNCHFYTDTTQKTYTEPFNYTYTDSTVTFPFYNAFYNPISTQTWKIYSKTNNSLIIKSTVYFNGYEIKRTLYLSK